MLLSCEQCRQFDQIAIQEFGIPGIVLMENAGAGCVRELEQRGRLRPSVILCGTGNNGGDGFVIARHLKNLGVPVSVILLGSVDKLSRDAKTNFEILKMMDTSIHEAGEHSGANFFESSFAEVGEDPMIIDAMLGTGAKGSLRDPYAKAVVAANDASAMRLAIDIPTGLDGDSGETDLAFRADLTFTFVAWKTGFENQSAKQWLGEVVVIDIGAPKSIYEQV